MEIAIIVEMVAALIHGRAVNRSHPDGDLQMTVVPENVMFPLISETFLRHLIIARLLVVLIKDQDLLVSPIFKHELCIYAVKDIFQVIHQSNIIINSDANDNY